MRAPRRTPWASQAELSDLYDMIYSSAADESSRLRAISRMSLYLSSPSCPAFLHLLHSLLSADLLPAPKTAAEKQAVRLTCAMAIVRFINGMVDPLQTGPYARPISHIAATLHIPPSLIALRHRATHEDLPPLPLLKQAIYSAIEYINQYSFLPSLASSSSAPLPRSLRAQTLVERWKKAIKGKLKAELSEAEFDREAKRIRRELDDEDIGEVLEALATVGGLIPLAKKKRPSSQAAEPTRASLQIWTPLIDHLAQSEPAFVNALVEQLLGLVQTYEHGKVSESASIRWSAVVWILHFWSDRRGPSPVGGEVKSRLRREVMSALVCGDEVWRRFSEELSELDPVYEAAISGLPTLTASMDVDGEEDEEGLAGLEVEEDAPVELDTDMVNGDDPITRMEARLAQFAKARGELARETDPPKHASHNADPSAHDVETGTGWTRLDDTCWKPCPIGSWGSSQRVRA